MITQVAQNRMLPLTAEDLAIRERFELTTQGIRAAIIVDDMAWHDRHDADYMRALAFATDDDKRFGQPHYGHES